MCLDCRLIVFISTSDKMKLYLQGEHLFNKKLIPHIYMSKDQIPPSLNCEGVLSTIYNYIQDWKQKLYELMSHNTKIAQVLDNINREKNLKADACRGQL